MPFLDKNRPALYNLVMAPHKQLIKFVKLKNYEPLLHELSEYNVTKFKSAEFHFSLYVDKFIFIRSSTVKCDNFGNLSVYKDTKKKETNIILSSKYELQVECVLKFEYIGKLDVKNYERIDFFIVLHIFTEKKIV